MTKPDRIPLFPLDVVLLPCMPLPLHIFEPRYKLMIRRCLNEHLEFGMVLATSDKIAKIGCTAEIIKKTKEYPDGRMDILTEGRSVFQLGQVFDEKQYYEGKVEYLEDSPAACDAEAQSRLVDLFEKCHMLLFGRSWDDAAQTDSEMLAYRMAGRLPMKLQERQALLEMRAEPDRRVFLMKWLAELQPQLAERQRVRERAGGNGHALN